MSHQLTLSKTETCKICACPILLKFDTVNDGILLFFGLSPVVAKVMGMISGALLPLPAFCLNSVQVLTVLSSVPHGDIIH